MSGSRIVVAGVVIGMLVSAYIAVPAQLTAASPSEAKSIVGAATCSGQGNAVTVCNGMWCWGSWKSHRHENMPDGEGEFEEADVYCPCDPTGGTTTCVFEGCEDPPT